MFRTLLTTTAMAALLTTGVMAQDTTTPAAPPAPPAGAPASPMDVPPAPNNGLTETPANTPVVMSEGYSALEGDHLASRILGSTVYTSGADDADHIGDINDLVVDNRGDVRAVVIGVGGFLGIGEKNVAVDFSELQWTSAADGTWRYVLNTTADALTAAPEFTFEDENTATNNDAGTANDAAVTPVAPGTVTTAPADSTAPAAGAIDRSTLSEFDETALTGDELKGTRVYGNGDEEIGTISDFVLGDDGTSIDAVIVDVGGFLGIGQKPVAVGFENLNFYTDADNNRYLFINATKEQLEAQPDFNRDTYNAERGTQRLVVAN